MPSLFAFRHRTGLANALPVGLHYPSAGTPNLNLDWEPQRRHKSWLEDFSQTLKEQGKALPFLPVPVAPLEAQLLGDWARALVGRSGLWISGYLLPCDETLSCAGRQFVRIAHAPAPCRFARNRKPVVMLRD